MYAWLLLALICGDWSVVVAQKCIPLWRYWGPIGQDKWCCMGFKACCGGNQSPINIDPKTVIIDNLTCLNFHNYHCMPKTVSIHNNGHQVELSFNSYNKIGIPYINGGPLENKFELDRLLFHWGGNSSVGAEHTLNNVQAAMEVQFVHRNEKYKSIAEARSSKDGLAIVSVFYLATHEDNNHIREVVYNLNYIKWLGHTRCINPLTFMNFIPWIYVGYYHYKGSLPFPPCYENVLWIVLHHPLTISNAQLNEFRKLQDMNEASCVGNSCPLINNFRKISCKYNRPVYFRHQCSQFQNSCG